MNTRTCLSDLISCFFEICFIMFCVFSNPKIILTPYIIVEQCSKISLSYCLDFSHKSTQRIDNDCYIFANIVYYHGFWPPKWGFLKYGYLQIIHFNGIFMGFHYKPFTLGYPHIWNPPNVGGFPLLRSRGRFLPQASTVTDGAQAEATKIGPTNSHMLHVWNIYLHLPQKLPKCR